jgi:hypothetical protein
MAMGVSSNLDKWLEEWMEEKVFMMVHPLETLPEDGAVDMPIAL